MKRTLFTSSLILIAVLILTACGAGGNSNQPATAPTTAPAVQSASGATQEVKIVNFSFTPATITVSAGTTVKWTNQDSAEHTVTADDGSFDSGQMAQGATFSFTFSKAGTFSYKCGNHPTMLGKVVVQ
jgi:plastocyanin